MRSVLPSLKFHSEMYHFTWVLTDPTPEVWAPASSSLHSFDTRSGAKAIAARCSLRIAYFHARKTEVFYSMCLVYFNELLFLENLAPLHC